MKVLIVGGGGREHAIAEKLLENPRIDTLYAAPGNGGMAAMATCLPIKATDIQAIADFCCEGKDGLCGGGPGRSPVLGIGGPAGGEKGIPAFGPDKKAAIIEGSKVFAKDLMKKYGIPTAAYEVFDDCDKALAYVQSRAGAHGGQGRWPGLGQGRAHLPNPGGGGGRRSLHDDRQRRFGMSGSRVVIEEFLTGPEVSVLAFTDGKTIMPMVSSMDHKRALDDDQGLNTGGMGTIAPNPYYTAEVAQRCMEEIFLPTIAAMNAEGRTFRGCLYFGLMLTPQTAPRSSSTTAASATRRRRWCCPCWRATC